MYTRTRRTHKIIECLHQKESKSNSRPLRACRSVIEPSQEHNSSSIMSIDRCGTFSMRVSANTHSCNNSRTYPSGYVKKAPILTPAM